MSDRVVAACSRCHAPAHWFDWTRAADGEERSQLLCDAELQPLCAGCAATLPAVDICACQHCQREHAALKERS